ncbi:MAG: EFR1 family ferrodoxin [Marinifilaceae bacterium]|jgi:ferredoxin/NAD(P)H-dependent FMN reductase|nr:EFR1 family ferrodoxin [Marinifilaceae bacterium]
MRVSILVFSPSGHTLKVAQLFKREFQNNDTIVQLIDITRNENYLEGSNIKEYLEEELDKHDILLIGGPVYAGHVEKNILNILDHLPEPGGKYGDLVVPFVSYGGVHSSIALEEMGKYINKKKRKSILGVKIATKHTLTQTLSNIINDGKPGKLEEEIISKAVERIIMTANKDYNKIKDVGRSFSYSKLPERILFKLLSQEFIHKKYKTVSIDTKKCIGCKKCVSVCPVNMFACSDNKIYIARDSSNCILCAECYHSCPSSAINYQYIEKAKERLEDGYAKLEKEQSAIYPKIKEDESWK